MYSLSIFVSSSSTHFASHSSFDNRQTYDPVLQYCLRKAPIPIIVPLSMAAFFTLNAQAQQLQVPSENDIDTEEPTVQASVTAIDKVVLDPINITGTELTTEFSTGLLGITDTMIAPFSATSLTEDFYDNIQARRLAGIVRRDPSVTVTNSASGYNSSLTIRGFEADFASTYWDGLGPQFNFGGPLPLNGYERVEIVKGPNTALRGAGAFSQIGGSFNYVPKRPPLPNQGPVRQVGITYSQNSLFEGTLDLGGRFGKAQQFGYRINGYVEDGELRANEVERDFEALDAVVDWQPNPDLKLTAGVHMINTRIDGYSGELAMPADIPIPDPPDPAKAFTQSWGYVEEDSVFGELRLDWFFADGWSLTAQYLNGQYDRDYLTGDGGEILTADGDFLIDVFQFEADFEFQNGALNVSNTQEFGNFFNTLTFSGAFGRSDGNQQFLVLDGFESNLYDPIFVPQPETVQNPELTQGREYRNYSYGLANQLEIGERWSLLLGARRVEIENTFTDNTTGEQTGGYDDGKTVPFAALSFTPVDRLLFYVNYSESFEEGGTAPDSAINALEQLPPREAEQYEVGAKWSILEELDLTFAAFQIDRTLEYLDIDSNRFVQDGTQRHRGIELIASGSIGERFTLFGGVMLLDPEVKDTGDPAADNDVPIGVPKVNVSLFGEYRLWKGLFANASLDYKGEQEIELPNNRTIDDFTRIDIGGRYEFELYGNQARIIANVQNVTDEEYWRGYGIGLALAEPRTFNLGLELEF